MCYLVAMNIATSSSRNQVMCHYKQFEHKKFIRKIELLCEKAFPYYESKSKVEKLDQGKLEWNQRNLKIRH